MSEVLQLTEVCFNHDANQVLNGINLTVNNGEYWAILGPNGSGKTTLASIIAGQLLPASGDVAVLDEKLGETTATDIASRVGFASSHLSRKLDPATTVNDAVISALYGVLGKTDEQFDAEDLERAHWLLRAFGVDHLKDRVVSTLSDGELQRVLICRALMADPEILLLDEPAAGLDMGAREELMGALSELAGHPSSPVIILITHHVEEIPAQFTHAALLKQGRISVAGKIDQVLTDDALSECFGLSLRVENHSGRWTAVGNR